MNKKVKKVKGPIRDKNGRFATKKAKVKTKRPVIKFKVGDKVIISRLSKFPTSLERMLKALEIPVKVSFIEPNGNLRLLVGWSAGSNCDSILYMRPSFLKKTTIRQSDLGKFNGRNSFSNHNSNITIGCNTFHRSDYIGFNRVMRTIIRHSTTENDLSIRLKEAMKISMSAELN